MTTETFDTPEAFMAALHGKPRTKRGRTTRPDLPAAGRSAPTGLSGLIAGKTRSWSTEYRVGAGYRLYRIDAPMDTGWCASEKAACDAAKAIEGAL